MRICSMHRQLDIRRTLPSHCASNPFWCKLMQACASNPVSRCFKCKQLVQQIRCSFDQVPEPVHFVLPAGKSACYASLRLHKAAKHIKHSLAPTQQGQKRMVSDSDRQHRLSRIWCLEAWRSCLHFECLHSCTWPPTPGVDWVFGETFSKAWRRSDVLRCFKCKQLVQQIRCSFDQVPEPVHFVLPAGKSACLRLHKAAQGCQTHQTLACPIEINAAGAEENGEWLGQTTQAQQDMLSRSMKKLPSLWMLALMHLAPDFRSGLGLWRNFLKSLASVLAHDRIQLLLMRPLRIPDLLSCARRSWQSRPAKVCTVLGSRFLKRDCTQSHSMKPLTQSNLTCKLYNIFGTFSHLCDISYFRDQPSIKPSVPSDQQRTALNGSLETPSFGSGKTFNVETQVCRHADHRTFWWCWGYHCNWGNALVWSWCCPQIFFAQLACTSANWETQPTQREKPFSVALAFLSNQEISRPKQKMKT